MQRLESTCLVDIHIGDHKEQILCYVAKLDVYTVVLGDGWLQTHNPAIDWRDRTMKFNAASCMESGCLTRGIPCIEYAIGSKAAKDKIGAEKLTVVDPEDIDIKPANAKHFFRMARQRDHEAYIWIPRVLSTDCTQDCGSTGQVAKWCANTTSKVAHEDYDKFKGN